MLFQGYSVAEFTKQKLCLIFDKNLYRLNSIQFHLYSTKTQQQAPRGALYRRLSSYNNTEQT